MPPALTTAESLVPHLKKCGYGDALIERSFKVDRVTIPVAAFAGRPFDSWSACIAAVNLHGDSRASAANVRVLGASTVFVCGPQRVDWWAMGPGGPTSSRPIAWPDVGGVFREHKDDLAPSRIYNAKLRRPGGSAWDRAIKESQFRASGESHPEGGFSSFPSSAHFKNVSFHVSFSSFFVFRDTSGLVWPHSDELPPFGGERLFYAKMMNRIWSPPVSVTDAQTRVGGSDRRR